MAERTAVYRMYGEDDELLYIGISSAPRSRFDQHRADKPWFRQVNRYSVEWYDSRREAEQAETAAIRLQQPVHNTRHNGWSSRVIPAVEVELPRECLPGMEMLSVAFGMKRDELLAALLERELAARGLLGGAPCHHGSDIPWPPSVIARPHEGTHAVCCHGELVVPLRPERIRIPRAFVPPPGHEVIRTATASDMGD